MRRCRRSSPPRSSRRTRPTSRTTTSKPIAYPRGSGRRRSLAFSPPFRRIWLRKRHKNFTALSDGLDMRCFGRYNRTSQSESVRGYGSARLRIQRTVVRSIHQHHMRNTSPVFASGVVLCPLACWGGVWFACFVCLCAGKLQPLRTFDRRIVTQIICQEGV